MMRVRRCTVAMHSTELYRTVPGGNTDLAFRFNTIIENFNDYEHDLVTSFI